MRHEDIQQASRTASASSRTGEVDAATEVILGGAIAARKTASSCSADVVAARFHITCAVYSVCL